MLDGAVLAGSIHGLEDEQQRPAILRIQHVLFFREPLSAALKEVGGFTLVHLQAPRITGIEILQLKAPAVGDAERVGVLLDLVENLFPRHSETSHL
ncbi:hypothetical protein [Bradyrhizobium neotropicale]|uniref:hypothetical protein n=1 Tax=Bradyrhizobium neotropicale TaxID=1497615 RepID=UPI00390831AA